MKQIQKWHKPNFPTLVDTLHKVTIASGPCMIKRVPVSVFVQESVGQHLFLMVSAVTQQMAKGPVDFVTEKALYTLSEDWLLWQAPDFSSLVHIHTHFLHFKTFVHLSGLLESKQEVLLCVVVYLLQIHGITTKLCV